MVVKSEGGRQREFKGVHFDVLATGERAMVARMNFTADNHVPLHQHPHTQVGYVLSGRYRVTIGATSDLLAEGDSYYVPGGVAHAMDVLEPGQIIDFFTPPREDYL